MKVLGGDNAFNLAEVNIVRASDGTYRWRLRYRHNGAMQTPGWTSQTVALDTWYCVEVKVVVGSGNGEARLYVDGTELQAFTGLDNDDQTTTADTMRLGIDTGWGSTAWDVKADCAKMADVYIGVEVTETQISVSDSATGSENIGKLRNVAPITDSGLGAEVISRPQRQMTITDLANGLEALFKLRELAAVTDGATGLELVTVGVAGVIKTKLFLILGDLAIQLTGD